MTVPSVTPSRSPPRAAAARGNRAARSAGTRPPSPPAIRCLPPTWRPSRIALEAEARLPRKDVPIVLYDAGEGLVAQAADRLKALGYTNVRQLDGGLQAWRQAGYELFEDVNSYAKAFGELVESRRHTPSLPARRSRRADCEQGQYHDSRCPALRRICHHEHSGLGQRARRRTGAARRPRRAGSRRPPSSSIAPAAPARSSAPSR